MAWECNSQMTIRISLKYYLMFTDVNAFGWGGLKTKSAYLAFADDVKPRVLIRRWRPGVTRSVQQLSLGTFDFSLPFPAFQHGQHRVEPSGPRRMALLKLRLVILFFNGMPGAWSVAITSMLLSGAPYLCSLSLGALLIAGFHFTWIPKRRITGIREPKVVDVSLPAVVLSFGSNPLPVQAPVSCQLLRLQLRWRTCRRVPCFLANPTAMRRRLVTRLCCSDFRIWTSMGTFSPYCLRSDFRDCSVHCYICEQCVATNSGKCANIFSRLKHCQPVIHSRKNPWTFYDQQTFPKSVPITSIKSCRSRVPMKNE